jgi:hypothetical protein
MLVSLANRAYIRVEKLKEILNFLTTRVLLGVEYETIVIVFIRLGIVFHIE